MKDQVQVALDVGAVPTDRLVMAPALLPNPPVIPHFFLQHFLEFSGASNDVLNGDLELGNW
jgi:hypothetical protein